MRHREPALHMLRCCKFVRDGNRPVGYSNPCWLVVCARPERITAREQALTRRCPAWQHSVVGQHFGQLQGVFGLALLHFCTASFGASLDASR
ncbi:MAG: hypothetical protein H7224_10115 [Polaromonas sp.]|nr:hypothetical protein [Polaromonas sp.]